MLTPFASSKLRRSLFPLSILGIVFSFHGPAFSQSCAPVSAQFITSGDDTTYAWINGTSLGATFSYCAITTCVATPVPVPTTLFNQGQSVVLAVETDNVNPNLVFSAWALVVDCSGGFQEVISSESSASISLDYDPNGAGAGVTGCSGAGAVPPPLDGSSNPWTSFFYNPASNPFTLTGAPITATSFSAPISVNGTPIPPISYNTSGYVPGSCGILYWRQVIVFPTPTPTATATFTPTLTATPTPTASFTQTFTPTASFTPTMTFTPTLTFTSTDSFTPTPTATVTDTPTATSTPTNTPTPTFTFTPCGYPGNTCTPTPTPPIFDVFTVDRNVLRPSQGPASILVEYSQYPGLLSLVVFNSAGEHIKTLDSRSLSSPVSQWYTWDGTNKHNDACASGVYVFSLQEPFSQKFKRILLIR